jgi:uncharacterized Zn-finger protein
MYKCDQCGRDLKHNSSLKRHIKLHEVGDDQVLTHPTPPSWTKTEEGSDKLEKALQFFKECHVCGKQMPKDVNLKRHIQAHFKIKEFMCNICNDKYADKQDYKLHVQRAHPEKAERMECTQKLQCDICLSSFQCKRDLELHKVESPLICTVCEKRFIRQQDFEYHMIRHAKSELPFNCDQCGKDFTGPFNLLKHVKLRGMRGHYCDQCGKLFSANEEFEYHMRTHILKSWTHGTMATYSRNTSPTQDCILLRCVRRLV